MRRKMPGQPFMNYVTVKSIDEMSGAVQANGGTIVLPKQEIGQGMGWISAFIDPENNLVGLHQAAATAPPKARAKKAATRRAVKTATRRKPAAKTSRRLRSSRRKTRRG